MLSGQSQHDYVPLSIANTYYTPYSKTLKVRDEGKLKNSPDRLGRCGTQHIRTLGVQMRQVQTTKFVRSYHQIFQVLCRRSREKTRSDDQYRPA